MRPVSHFALCGLAAVGLATALPAADPVCLTIQAGQPGKAISPDIFGIFFEDLSYGADGGLYAELVHNRSFEYSPADSHRNDKNKWHSLSFWELVQRGGGTGTLAVDTASPLNAINTHYVTLTVDKAGDGVGVSNPGFDGITLKAGATYDVSVFARQISGTAAALRVRLETPAGQVLASATLPAPNGTWGKRTAVLKATANATDARVVVLVGAPGVVALDMISLFPQATFKNRPNGLRADLAQVIADLHPKFMRFPGGCVAHGDGLPNMYHWKDSIGPVETRKGIPNIWRYHQSRGLGYFEYFQFCEDIGAKPLPVLPAGVSCQNSYYKRETGQECIPMAEMPAYIQDVLDLIEYANGPATSTWGAKRAAAGHPAPFKLQYLGIGNEDRITPGFSERFTMIYNAVKAKHPEIDVIGTVGPNPDGRDFDQGWELAKALRVPLVDEHYYKNPEWFLDNLDRYDGYDRTGTHVYAGEYAARTARQHLMSPFHAGLAEAAYLTGLERNGDVVRLASYAPLIANMLHVSWTPNLVFFNNTDVYPGSSYYVQQAFASNAGDRYLSYTVTGPDREPTGKRPRLAHSVVRDSASKDLIIKLVNVTKDAQPVQVAVKGLKSGSVTAARTLLTADPGAMNIPGKPAVVTPRHDSMTVGATFGYEAPAHSLTVIRIPGR